MPSAKSATTTLQVAQTMSAKSPLIEGLVSDHQCEPLTEAQCIERGLPPTSKSFARLGIADDRKIIWPHANFNLEDWNLLGAFCQSQGLATKELLARVCMTWLETNREAVTIAADGFIQDELSVEELVKKAGAAQRLLDKTMAMIAKMKVQEEEDNEPSE